MRSSQRSCWAQEGSRPGEVRLGIGAPLSAMRAGGRFSSTIRCCPIQDLGLWTHTGCEPKPLVTGSGDRSLLPPCSMESRVSAIRYGSTMSLETIIPSIIGFVGVAVGTVVASLAAARQSRADTRIAITQIESQQMLAREQAVDELELERERHRRERLEEAYIQLMIWCASLEETINLIWIACAEPGSDGLRRAHAMARDWPFIVLVEPKEAAGHRHYWSEDVHDLLEEFRGASGRFVKPANILLSAYVSGTRPAVAHEESYKDQVLNSRGALAGVLTRIRQRAHDDIFLDGRDVSLAPPR